jgi:hypothetical protein
VSATFSGDEAKKWNSTGRERRLAVRCPDDDHWPHRISTSQIGGTISTTDARQTLGNTLAVVVWRSNVVVLGMILRTAIFVFGDRQRLRLGASCTSNDGDDDGLGLFSSGPPSDGSAIT